VTAGVRELRARAVTLTGSVNPHGRATRYRFEYGTGTSLNRRTALVAAGAVTVTVPVSAALTLSPNKRYSYRLVARSSAGTVRGARRSFTSPRAHAALTFALESRRVPYAGTVVVTGSATSAGAEASRWHSSARSSRTGVFEQVATQRSASNGAYRFTFSPLLLSARFRVLARTTPTATSVAKKIRTTVLAGLTVTRRHHRRLRLAVVLHAGQGAAEPVPRRGHDRRTAAPDVSLPASPVRPRRRPPLRRLLPRSSAPGEVGHGWPSCLLGSPLCE